MNKVELIEQFNEDQIRSFLKNVHYTKFNLYPNVRENSLKKYLLEVLKNKNKTEKIFIFLENSKIIALSTLRKLDWDSQHFGYKCATIDHVLVNNTIDYKTCKTALVKLIMEIEKQAMQDNIKFMSVSIRSWDHISASALQSNNFNYILTWIDGVFKSKEQLTFHHKSNEIGIVDESEIEYYKNLASINYFKGGRFYIDPNIDNSAVEQMYSKLIETSYHNNDIILSYRVKGKPVGLFICNKIKTYNHFNKLRVAPLRYLVIDPNVRQKHIGYDLFVATLNYLMDRSDITTTGLEVHNLPSLNLHSKLDFK